MRSTDKSHAEIFSSKIIMVKLLQMVTIDPFRFLGDMIFGDCFVLIGPYIKSEKNQSKSLANYFWFLGDWNLGDVSHAYFSIQIKIF